MNMQPPSPDVNSLAKGLIAIGAVILLAGIFLLYKDKVSFLKFIGKLPGDVSVEKENFRFYFPITTSLLLSAILSFLFWLFRKN